MQKTNSNKGLKIYSINQKIKVFSFFGNGNVLWHSIMQKDETSDDSF